MGQIEVALVGAFVTKQTPRLNPIKKMADPMTRFAPNIAVQHSLGLPRSQPYHSPSLFNEIREIT